MSKPTVCIPWFFRWPLGHGFYAKNALRESVAENRRAAWLFISSADIADEIRASLFARRFGVIDDDFLRMSRGDDVLREGVALGVRYAHHRGRKPPHDPCKSCAADVSAVMEDIQRGMARGVRG